MISDICIAGVLQRLIGFLTVAALAGCAQSGSVAPSPKDPSARSYLGLTLDQAQVLAQKSRQSFRVVKRDGVDLQVTFDFIPGRINAEVVDGLVVAFAVEGSSPGNKLSLNNAVSENCLVFFDGCNQCRRSAPGDPAACTRKACSIVEASYCLDE
ncbi:MAG: hypothetical protein ISP99_05495 [Pseudomonadales bacterium]|nr:hypothetical protein [Pseudomonadales bacterium]